MLTFTTDVKLPNTLQQSPVVKQNNGIHKYGVKQKRLEIKGVVNGHREPVIVGSELDLLSQVTLNVENK